MALLFSNQYASLDLDQSVVRYVRNGEIFPSIEELVQSHGDVARALDRLGRARYALIADVRAARGANTPEVERAMLSERRRLLYGFNRVAVIVRSAAGALQVQRHAREDGIALRVFLDDERGALAYARGSGPVVPQPISERMPSSGVIEKAPSSGVPASVGVSRLGGKLGR